LTHCERRVLRRRKQEEFVFALSASSSIGNEKNKNIRGTERSPHVNRRKGATLGFKKDDSAPRPTTAFPLFPLSRSFIHILYSSFIRRDTKHETRNSHVPRHPSTRAFIFRRRHSLHFKYELIEQRTYSDHAHENHVLTVFFTRIVGGVQQIVVRQLSLHVKSYVHQMISKQIESFVCIYIPINYFK
jgi:hypothetical protein